MKSKEEIKTPREIMIKHWMRRMKQVYRIDDLEEEDFKQQESEFQFMIDAIEEYHSQFSAQVTDGWRDGMPPYDGKFLCFIRQPQECGNTWEYQRVVDCSMNLWLSLFDRETVIRWRLLPENPNTPNQ